MDGLGPLWLHGKAFPIGIPERIFSGFDHRKPFKGDHGVRWELNPDEAEWLDHYEAWRRA